MDILVQLSVNYGATRENFSNFSCVLQILKKLSHLGKNMGTSHNFLTPHPHSVGYLVRNFETKPLKN